MENRQFMVMRFDFCVEKLYPTLKSNKAGLCSVSESSLLDQENETLKIRYQELGQKLDSFASEVSLTLENLETFFSTFDDVGTWLTHRLGQVTQLQLKSADLDQVHTLAVNLDGVRDDLETFAPQIDGLRQRGSELLRTNEKARGASRIRGLLVDVDHKWQALIRLCNEKNSDLADARTRILDLDRRYNELDGELRQHSRSFEATVTTPSSMEQLEKVSISAQNGTDFGNNLRSKESNIYWFMVSSRF